MQLMSSTRKLDELIVYRLETGSEMMRSVAASLVAELLYAVPFYSSQKHLGVICKAVGQAFDVVMVRTPACCMWMQSKLSTKRKLALTDLEPAASVSLL